MKRLPSGEIVYDPRGTVTTEPTDLAARLPRLEGVRLGVLDNSKWNAKKLLRGIIALLREKHRLGEVIFYKKESFSKVAPQALIDHIIDQTDAVLTAVGD